MGQVLRIGQVHEVIVRWLKNLSHEQLYFSRLFEKKNVNILELSDYLKCPDRLLMPVSLLPMTDLCTMLS